MNCNAHRLTLFVDHGPFSEYESGAELVRSLFDQPTTHRDPEDDQLRRD